MIHVDHILRRSSLSHQLAHVLAPFLKFYLVMCINNVISLQVNSKVDGKAPIHWAIQANSIDALKCLLDHYADVNILVSTNAYTKKLM